MPTPQTPSIIKQLRQNLIRKVQSHLTGLDAGSNAPALLEAGAASQAGAAGIISAVVTNDQKFPLHVIVDNNPIDPLTTTVGDPSNPDDNLLKYYTRTVKNQTNAVGSPTAYTSATDVTLYTVSSGKKLYMTSVTLWPSGTAGAIYLRDGTAGSAVLSLGNQLSGGSASVATYTFPTALVFATSVVFNDAGGNGNLYWTFTGYEQ